MAKPHNATSVSSVFSLRKYVALPLVNDVGFFHIIYLVLLKIILGVQGNWITFPGCWMEVLVGALVMIKRIHGKI